MKYQRACAVILLLLSNCRSRLPIPTEVLEVEAFSKPDAKLKLYPPDFPRSRPYFRVRLRNKEFWQLYIGHVGPYVKVIACKKEEPSLPLRDEIDFGVSFPYFVGGTQDQLYIWFQNIPKDRTLQNTSGSDFLRLESDACVYVYNGTYTVDHYTISRVPLYNLRNALSIEDGFRK